MFAAIAVAAVAAAGVSSRRCRWRRRAAGDHRRPCSSGDCSSRCLPWVSAPFCISRIGWRNGSSCLYLWGRRSRCPHHHHHHYHHHAAPAVGVAAAAAVAAAKLLLLLQQQQQRVLLAAAAIVLCRCCCHYLSVSLSVCLSLLVVSSPVCLFLRYLCLSVSSCNFCLSGLTGWKYSRRIAAIKVFEFLMLNGRCPSSLRVGICVSGYLRDDDDVTLPWVLSLAAAAAGFAAAVRLLLLLSRELGGGSILGAAAAVAAVGLCGVSSDVFLPESSM